MRLAKNIVDEVINFCNRDLVPDQHFDIEHEDPKQWFTMYFHFLNDSALETQLGDAFYQARLMYKMMSALNLRREEQKGTIKFQIVQYASICEAILDTAIMRYFDADVKEALSVTEYLPLQNAVSVSTKITYNNTPLILCQAKKKNAVLKRTRVDAKTGYAANKGIITENMKSRLDSLYELRNNVHILKATSSQYSPKLTEAKDAFILMQDFVNEVKQYYIANPT